MVLGLRLRLTLVSADGLLGSFGSTSELHRLDSWRFNDTFSELKASEHSLRLVDVKVRVRAYSRPNPVTREFGVFVKRLALSGFRETPLVPIDWVSETTIEGNGEPIDYEFSFRERNESILDFPLQPFEWQRDEFGLHFTLSTFNTYNTSNRDHLERYWIDCINMKLVVDVDGELPLTTPRLQPVTRPPRPDENEARSESDVPATLDDAAVDDDDNSSATLLILMVVVIVLNVVLLVGIAFVLFRNSSSVAAHRSGETMSAASDEMRSARVHAGGSIASSSGSTNIYGSTGGGGGASEYSVGDLTA